MAMKCVLCVGLLGKYDWVQDCSGDAGTTGQQPCLPNVIKKYI